MISHCIHYIYRLSLSLSLIIRTFHDPTNHPWYKSRRWCVEAHGVKKYPFFFFLKGSWLVEISIQRTQWLFFVVFFFLYISIENQPSILLNSKRATPHQPTNHSFPSTSSSFIAETHRSLHRFDLPSLPPSLPSFFLSSPLRQSLPKVSHRIPPLIDLLDRPESIEVAEEWGRGGEAMRFPLWKAGKWKSSRLCLSNIWCFCMRAGPVGSPSRRRAEARARCMRANAPQDAWIL